MQLATSPTAPARRVLDAGPPSATPSAATATAIDSTGRVVLPASVRRRLNLHTGSRLVVRVVAGHIELVPEAAPGPALAHTGQRLVLAATGAPFDAAAAVRQERDQQARRGLGK